MKSRALKEAVNTPQPKSHKALLKEIHQSGKEDMTYGKEHMLRGKITMMGAKMMMKKPDMLDMGR